MLKARDLLAICSAQVLGTLLSGVVTARIRGSATTPLSDCEKACIDKHPDDTDKRLSCMLKCVADGKIAVSRTFMLQ